MLNFVEFYVFHKQHFSITQNDFDICFLIKPSHLNALGLRYLHNNILKTENRSYIVISYEGYASKHV